MPTRRSVVQAVAASFLRGQSPQRKPNLLFLIADDHARYVTRCYGNARALTPNLDRLAAGGVRFASNYCNSPVCTPSRQCILTGQLPHAAGVTLLSTPLAEDKPTIAKSLAASGYRTAVFGKMHFNQSGRPGLHGFELAITEDVVQKRWQAETGASSPPGNVKTKPVWRPFKDPARIWLNADDLPFPRPYEQMKSTWVAQQACRFLDEHAKEPFALWVSLTEPHSPFDFPIGDESRFAPAQFPVPRVGPQDAAQIPLIFRSLSPADKQGIVAAYYTSVHYLDRNMGVVLSRLSQLGLDENTLVIYMADHGYSLGQHGRFEKHCCYEPALVVPLLMRWKGRIRPRVIQDFTESVDVPHTILDLMGADPLPLRHGQSLRPYLQTGLMPGARQHIFSEYLENEEACVRTHRWKYVHCSGKRARKDGYETDNPTPGRSVRLFDQVNDPGEFQDVSARHPDVVRRLSALMLERFRTTHPHAAAEPAGMRGDDAIDWYLRPRD